MGAPRSPQQKKALSYSRDRRNVYGENAKASRKAIPRRKSKALRAYRHGVKQALREALRAAGIETADAAEAKAASIVRDRRWRKSPDAPLGAVVRARLARRVRSVGAKRARRDAYSKGEVYDALAPR